MKRRQFLQAGALMLVSGKFVYDAFNKLNEIETRNKIYDLGQYVYLANYKGITKEKTEKEQKGCGIVLEDYFFTCDHIPSSIEKNKMMTPFGLFEEDVELKSKSQNINGLEMEELVRNPEKDIAIYWIGKDRAKKHNIKQFPCKPSSNRIHGQTAYLIGNPNLRGINIRKTTISDLDGMIVEPKNDIVEMTKYGFGISNQLIPGDSGSPLVNDDYELIGINNIGVNGGIGYAIKIEEFFKELKNG